MGIVKHTLGLNGSLILPGIAAKTNHKALSQWGRKRQDFSLVWRALCCAGGPLRQVEGAVGDLFRSMCPAARTLPSSNQLYRKYLQMIFDEILENVKDFVRGPQNADFKALHFKDPCDLLNNMLEECMKLTCFKGTHDLIVHFPAMVKSFRELRQKFVSRLIPTGIGPGSLTTITTSFWFSFYLHFLQHWRAVMELLRHDNRTGKRLKSWGRWCQCRRSYSSSSPNWSSWNRVWMKYWWLSSSWKARKQ